MTQYLIRRSFWAFFLFVVATMITYVIFFVVPADPALLAAGKATKPEIVNHNTETVPRLYRRVRPEARYEQSLELLRRADAFRRETGSAIKTKSGLMAGLGESTDELLATLSDLRDAGCDIATVGQYLQPHERRLPVEKYYTPEEFDDLRREAEAMGFLRVESGPLVRSSYHAKRALQ